MDIKINDKAVVAAAKAVSLDYQKYLASMRIALEAAAPHLPRFTYTEEDLLSLARGVVPEWLRFDADAALDEELAK